MKKIVKWYLSGFYKKPKGLKKPYNPILGETFRCYWEHPNGSKTFYIAEQVSHHPPISANYVANREDGFTISASILAKSKFYGNSTSALLEGNATISLLPRGEEYVMTLPYAHCKGILMGTLTMELGGKVTIECSKTGYTTEMDFKLRPFLGGGEFTNAISGKIRLAKETLVTIDGHWDDSVKMKDKKTGLEEVLWEVTDEVRAARLKRFVVPQDEQNEFESTKLWRKVSEAIANDDQNAATEEKTVLEEAQRAEARIRKETGVEHKPQHFEYEAMNNTYVYKHADSRPWDPLNDLYQYEKEYLILTKTKHKTPMIRTQSIVSVSDKAKKAAEKASGAKRPHRKTTKATEAEVAGDESDCGGKAKVAEANNDNLEVLIQPLRDQQRQMTERLAKLQHSLDVMSYQQKERDSNSNINRDMVLLVVLVVMIQVSDTIPISAIYLQFTLHFIFRPCLIGS